MEMEETKKKIKIKCIKNLAKSSCTSINHSSMLNKKKYFFNAPQTYVFYAPQSNQVAF